MTTENAYVKLAAVMQQLGEERTKNDRLTVEYGILLQAYRDLEKAFAQYRERYPDVIR